MEEIWKMRRPQLRELLEKGYKIDPKELGGFAYHGVSLGLPRWIEALSWKTFTKAFVSDDSGVRGWNIRMQQTGVDGARLPVKRKGRDKCFGHFAVRALSAGKMQQRFPNALILDYGAKSIQADPMLRGMRDPIVALQENDARLLLGCSWLSVAGGEFATPSYFTLQRTERLEGESVKWNEGA